jgi:hypothetical protein
MIVIDYKLGTNKEREIAERVVKWCLEYFHLEWYGLDINLEICKYKTYKCWGTCVEGDICEIVADGTEVPHSFNITIANDQSIRDFVATITHEMVHVKQYVTGKWRGDGEKECERLQYKLADKLWKEGIL